MFRFAEPNGSPFGLDYNGTIFALDSEGDVVAICRGGKTFTEKLKDTGNLDSEGYLVGDLDEVVAQQGDIGEPDKWEDWEIVISAEIEEPILQRAIASAWISASLVERIIFQTKNQE